MPPLETWMKDALALARKGEGLTRPNPPVGALVVKGDRCLGRGYHRRAGGPHAEIIALKAAGKRAKGATLLVTLEPCSTQGKTPPCTEAISQSGVSRVVVAVRDPNPRHRGRGLKALKRSGVDVVEGVCQAEAKTLIAPFRKWIQTGKPYVTLKLAMTLDGRIADSNRRSKWITSPAARKEVQAMRRRADAILVGSGTIRADDPSLLCRPKPRKSLYRVVMTTGGIIPESARILTDKARENTIIATTVTCARHRIQRLRATGATVWELPQTRAGVSLKRLLGKLGRMGLLHVICEGGAELAASLVRENLVDEYVIFMAPKLLGGESLSALGGKGWPIKACPKLKLVSHEHIGPDLMITAKPLGSNL